MSISQKVSAAAAVEIAILQSANERTAIYFATSMAGLCLLIIMAHFASLSSKASSINREGVLIRSLIKKERFLRSCLIHKIPFFPSLGHGLVFMVYIALNITLLLQHLDLNVLRDWAKRMGWIAVCNIALITFLALKNTPLAFLAANSYERLNILHQAAGCCGVLFATLHGVLSIVTYAQLHDLSYLVELPQKMAIVAALSMSIMALTAMTFRGPRYEAFYIIHIILFMLVIISLGIHRPELQTKSIYITIFSACIWFCDRMLRGSRIFIHSFGNRAAIYPLSHDGIRIVMQCTPWRAVPGTHIFLWIPKIRAIETHPFTIVSTNPLEVVLSKYDGFTGDLSSLAKCMPGIMLRASCDGPYGVLPNFAKFDTVILVAGGSGASFTVGVAINLVRTLPSNAAGPMIHMIWAIRKEDMKTWFAKELTELSASAKVKLSVYVTGPPQIEPLAFDEQISSLTHASTLGDLEKSISVVEKSPPLSERCGPIVSGASLPIIHGRRPNISTIVRAIVSGTEDHERAIIAACGPESMMKETRAIARDLVASSGRSVTLHCEQFGW